MPRCADCARPTVRLSGRGEDLMMCQLSTRNIITTGSAQCTGTWALECIACNSTALVLTAYLMADSSCCALSSGYSFASKTAQVVLNPPSKDTCPSHTVQSMQQQRVTSEWSYLVADSSCCALSSCHSFASKATQSMPNAPSIVMHLHHITTNAEPG